MAENTGIFSQLRKLLSNNIIIKKSDGGGVVVKDFDSTQSGYMTNFIDRYNRMHQGYNKNKFVKQSTNAYEVARVELFKGYELMDNDPIISSALDIYSDESTVSDVEGKILKIKTDNPKLHAILDNLFYDIINLEFNLWSWIRNMNKYGDFYLHLDIVDKHGIVNVKPLSPYEVKRMEDHDQENPNLVQFVLDGDEKDIKENYEIAHFRLLSEANFIPYGKSQLEGARKIFKQLTLMEDAMLIHRIMRAPEKRIFKVDIGNIPPNEVENFMNKLINKMKKIPVIDQKTGEYNLKYNVESVTEDFFLPVRGSDSGTSIESLPGLSNDNAIEDIEYLRNKMMAALKIPKAFLGYEEGVGSKATLAAEDVRFSRTIERLQKIIIAELTKIAIIHLYTQGFEDAELLNFDLELTNPSMIHEQEKLELLTQRKDIANDLLENKLVSREWVYDNIFDFNQHEKEKIFEGIIEDQKQKFRMTQIEDEGNDPVESGEKAGDEEDLKMARRDAWGGDRRSGTAEKEYGNEYDSEDLKNATSYERGANGKREFKGGSPLAVGKGSTLVRSESKNNLIKLLQKKYKTAKSSILNEESLIEDE